MFRSKRIYCLYLISALVFILLAQLALAQELTPAKKTAISWVDRAKVTYEEIAKYLWDNPELG
jgi:neutral trehalase